MYAVEVRKIIYYDGIETLSLGRTEIVLNAKTKRYYLRCSLDFFERQVIEFLQCSNKM